MKFKKPSFWDYKKPNILSYILLPITFLINFINFLNNKNKIKHQKIKTICVGNIYIGGTGKTPISVKINKILNNLNYKTAFIKKNYYDQIDEQKLLSSKFNNVNQLVKLIDQSFKQKQNYTNKTIKLKKIGSNILNHTLTDIDYYL